ncbi:MAG: hypothetical protein JJ895_10760 [Balneolaceae bacterium]|nr:hypothetical protein [Balneolaceae bacterium]
MKLIQVLKRTWKRGQRLIPYPILKYVDVLLQSLNPVFWVRAIRSFKEFACLMRQQRVEINDFEKQHGLKAIMYFTGDISIYIEEQKIDDLDELLVENFTSDLRKKSHTITRLPSVMMAWLGQISGALTYMKWNSIIDSTNQIIHKLQGFL